VEVRVGPVVTSLSNFDATVSRGELTTALLQSKLTVSRLPTEPTALAHILGVSSSWPPANRCPPRLQGVDVRLVQQGPTFTTCPTYPALLTVPRAITDAQVASAASFRSKGRLPILVGSVAHGEAGTSLMLRSAQPLTGLSGVFLGFGSKTNNDDARILREAAALSPARRLVILDSRPRLNAEANRLGGGGYEAVARLGRGIDLEFAGIGNIHVVRGALAEVWVNPSSTICAARWLEQMRRVLAAANRVATLLEEERTSVLIRCSDGWDRTAQVVCLAHLLLEHRWRTMAGFITLIEDQWLAFGHKFAQRGGVLPDERAVDFADTQRAPIFDQFLEAVGLLLRQYPTAFEFSIDFLVYLRSAYRVGTYGTFRGNCVLERRTARLAERTPSLWAVLPQSRRPPGADKLPRLATSSPWANPAYSASRNAYRTRSLRVRLGPGDVVVQPAFYRAAIALRDGTLPPIEPIVPGATDGRAALLGVPDPTALLAGRAPPALAPLDSSSPPPVLASSTHAALADSTMVGSRSPAAHAMTAPLSPASPVSPSPTSSSRSSSSTGIRRHPRHRRRTMSKGPLVHSP